MRSCAAAIAGGYEVVGIRHGLLGLAESDTLALDRRAVAGILPRGGTILGTSSFDCFREPNGVERVIGRNPRARASTGSSRSAARARSRSPQRLHAEHGFPVVGVPKTIDNDIGGTDVTIGFDTAVQICTEAIDRLHSTAESHNRVMVVEVMGRSTGWIAAAAGIAGGADVILVPEVPTAIEDVADHV